jgi:hypothetical protein
MSVLNINSTSNKRRSNFASRSNPHNRSCSHQTYKRKRLNADFLDVSLRHFRPLRGARKHPLAQTHASRTLVPNITRSSSKPGLNIS